MGQVGTGRAALTVESSSNDTAIHNSTFSHGYGPGIEIRMAELVQITDSVVVDTEGPAIAVWNDRRKTNGKAIPDQPKAIILRNTAGFARKLGENVRLDTVSGFVLCPYSQSCMVHAENNTAAGSENYGFVFGRYAAHHLLQSVNSRHCSTSGDSLHDPSNQGIVIMNKMAYAILVTGTISFSTTLQLQLGCPVFLY